MAIRPVKRKGSPFYQTAGSIKGHGRVRESTGTSKLAEAKEICAQIEREIRDSLKSKQTLTLSHAIVEYTEHTGHKQYLKRINEIMGKMPLDQINQETIDRAAREAYKDYKRGEKGKARKYSKATIKRQFYTPLASVLHYVHRLNWIPYIRVEMPDVKRPTPQWATEKWFKEFFKHADDDLKAITTFLAGTGCRISEALNLRPQDVDLAKGEAMVRTTKNGLPREAHLPKFVMVAVTPYLKGERVFDMYPASWAVNYRLEKTAKEAGIEYLSTHKVGSHTFATNLAKYAGMDAKALTETGRWKDPKSTHHYTHYLKREQARKADVLEELFK